ncbi:MAG: ABC transporter substrate-binding protein [Brucellaceae bacterium]|nr:ABC transporter substrate-binding protein [Brucellaceae bacterium]
MRGKFSTATNILSAGVLAAGMMLAAPAMSQEETIKVGVLHSLSGTMAISETTLKDVMLMLIDEQNAKGGLLGKKLEAVVVDPASDWPLFAEKARELISVNGVSAVFGCWTSVSRKSVLPVFEELNSLLFYPVQYEGEESQRNVFYTGAAPNQQAIPAVDYLMNEEGVERWVLAGTDYVYPQTTNKILQAYLEAKGVAADDIMVNYTPFGHSDWQTIVTDIKNFGSAGKKTAVVSTINGDANVPFYKENSPAGHQGRGHPGRGLSRSVARNSRASTRSAGRPPRSWNYFQSVDNEDNSAFIDKWKEFTGNPDRVTNDPMEARDRLQHMGQRRSEGRTDRSGRRHRRHRPRLGAEPDRRLLDHDATTHPQAGADRRDQDDSQFEVVWETPGLVVGDEWSDYLPDSRT